MNRGLSRAFYLPQGNMRGNPLTIIIDCGAKRHCVSHAMLLPNRMQQFLQLLKEHLRSPTRRVINLTRLQVKVLRKQTSKRATSSLHKT